MKKCSVPNYILPIKGRELCNKHYFQALRGKRQFGDNRTEIALRFILICVNSSTSKCLTPDFQLKSDYPSFIYNGVYYKLGWMVLEKTGRPKPISNNKIVMRHVICGNSRCCNPKHLEWGTEVENCADKKIHGTEYNKFGTNNPNYRHGKYVK